MTTSVPLGSSRFAPRSRSRAAAALTLAAALAGCASNTHTPLQVAVRDAATKQPISGAKLLIMTAEPFHPLRFPSDYVKENRPDAVPQYTDAAGLARFDVVGPGPLEFVLIAPELGADSVYFDEFPLAEGQSATKWYTLPRGLPADPAAYTGRRFELQFRAIQDASSRR